MNKLVKFTRLEDLDEADTRKNSSSRTRNLPRVCLICTILTLVVILVITILTVCLVVAFVLERDQIPIDNFCDTDTPPLLILSLDGFRPDYLDSGLVPTLYKFSEEGVRAGYLMSQFPTITYPNHYSIATGLHPAWHGIVDNIFYDKTLNQTFNISSKGANDDKWWLGDPIWKLARDEGLKTACYFWPGSEVDSLLPNYYFPYQRNTPLIKQLRQVNSWLQLSEEKRPRLMMVYSYQPDSASHSYGYYSNEMNDTLREIDSSLNKFLSNSSIWNCVDKIIVSDHGFANVSKAKTLYLDDIIDISLIYPVEQGPILTFNVIIKLQTDIILNAIRADSRHGVIFDAYKSTGLPPRMHYGLTPRYSDVTIVNKVGWLMLYSRSKSKYTELGAHGWDNHARDMRALFIAQGPSFKHNYKYRAFENTHIFDLLTTLLRIQPSANNGSMGALNDIISSSFKGNLPPIEPSPQSNDTEVECRFPSLQLTKERVFCSECVCGSCNISQLDYVLDLNLTETEINSIKSNLIPGGLPVGGGGSEYCYLANGDSLIKYSLKLRVPVWTAFMVDISNYTPSGGLENCSHLNDPRIPTDVSPLCSDYTRANNSYSMVSLLPLQFARKGAALTSATLPLKHLPTYLLNHTLSRLIARHEDRSYVVVTGAVFLSPTSGERVSGDKWDQWLANRLAIPSHVYQVIMRCLKVDNKCTLDTSNVIGYVVENTDTVINPQSISEAYQLRMTTIREIERMSGVNFFHSLSLKQQLNIELMLATEFDE